MEISDVRRRVRAAIEAARTRAEARRVSRDEASRAWEGVRSDLAVPAFHQVASALVGEGHRFKVVTPGEAVRLTPDRGGEEFVELALVTEREEPALVLTSTRGRGRRVITTEHVFRDGPAIASVSEEEIVAALLEALTPFLEP